ncbi:MAG: pyridoxal kinase PdxY [Hyphomicrobiales bacterium]|nr:pyridoxal kinase PdxY [Hyphomicrobiales bacterium]
MNILSIQSQVVYGHVGNSAAVFPLQRLGHEVWPINTVQFSNHTGHGAWRGDIFPARLIDDCVQGVAERGVLPSCNGVLSGYVGAPETGAAILRAVSAVKQANPGALYCCDPVMGDVGRGVFVRPGVPEFFEREALAHADIVTPNHFELQLLTGASIRSREELTHALRTLSARGPQIAMVTSLTLDDTPHDRIDIAAFSPQASLRIRTPRLAVSANGAGDLVAALFFAHFLVARNVKTALENAASSVFGVLAAMEKNHLRELPLIAAQGEIVAPTHRFEATAI